ncbi:activating signal cointegrator 1 [Tanacetum coccineum]
MPNPLIHLALLVYKQLSMLLLLPKKKLSMLLLLSQGSFFPEMTCKFVVDTGCVEVVGCLKSEELASWEDVPQGVRLEGLTAFCWLCEKPQKLLIPFEMRGYQGVYNLERRVLEGALKGLRPVEAPMTIKFPLPDPQNPFSLTPGSLVNGLDKGSIKTKTDEDSSPTLKAAIAGAKAAATQFSKKTNSSPTVVFQGEGSRTRSGTKEGVQILDNE